MGRRGPIATPTTLKVAAGTRADRINRDEPIPPRSADPPEPPDGTLPEARAHWDRLAPSLHAAGLLTEWDVDTLATYCELLVLKTKAAQMIDKGMLVEGRRDPLVTNPAWRAYRDIVDRLRLYAHELGLTPSARSGLTRSKLDTFDPTSGREVG